METRVVWDRDIRNVPYLRQSVVYHRQARGPIALRIKGATRFGYTECEPGTADDEGYRRRIFWLKPHDRFFQPHGVYRTGRPAEAVDPRAIFYKEDPMTH